MQVAVLKETFPGERRVALVPGVIPSLTKAGAHVKVEAGAGVAAGFDDEAYRDKGAEIVSDRAQLFQSADVIAQVRGLGMNLEAGREDLQHYRPGQYVVATFDPLSQPEAVRDFAGTGASLFALEMIPRITRAQSMDVLSSMATIAGYKAVLIAANRLPRMFPMLMTAAGTIAAAKVFVIGAGVAGLQAIATAKRLGARVEGYDVRPAAMEQIASLGGKPVQLNLQTDEAEDKGGYAKALTEEQQKMQREQLAEYIGKCDVCITTAAIPGRPSPLLVTADAVRRMPRGSVIIDLAAERGGNCELTKADETVDVDGVTILGPTNLASEIPLHASQMFAKNVATFLLSLVKDGRIELDAEDEVVRDTLVTAGGKITSVRIAELLGEQPTDVAVALGKKEADTPAPPAKSDDDEYQLEENN